MPVDEMMLSRLDDDSPNVGMALDTPASTPEWNPPQDSAMPFLAEAFDTDNMARHFAREMFALVGEPIGTGNDRYTIESCRVERARYRPGQRCSIGYRLLVHDRDTGRRHEHMLCGRVYERDGSRSRFTKFANNPLIKPAFGPPLFHIDSLDMIVWSFPNDRKLTGLPVVMDVDRLKRDVVPSLVLPRWGAGWTVAGMSHSVANYVQERRCCIRVELDLLHLETGATRPWTIFGKTYSDNHGAMVHRTALQLWHSELRVRGEFGLPRPLAYLPEHRLLWQEMLPGSPLAQFPNDGLDPELFAAAARAVAALHSTPVIGTRQYRVANVIRRLRLRADMIYRGWPSSRAALTNVVDRLIDAAPRLDHETLATVHGDLHSENIFIDGGRASLIDLDEAVSGPPLRDIGRFFAAELSEPLVDNRSMARIGSVIGAFVRQYRSRVVWSVRPEEIAWYVAAGLINEQIFRCVTLMRPDRDERLNRLIDLADRLGRRDDDLLGLGNGPYVVAAPSGTAHPERSRDA